MSSRLGRHRVHQGRPRSGYTRFLASGMVFGLRCTAARREPTPEGACAPGEVGRVSPDEEAGSPPELPGFVPIRPNPYIVGNPVRGRAMFFGRDAEFALVRERFTSTERGGLLVFCG